MTIAIIPGTKLSIASMLDITERKQLEKQILNVSERERHKIGQELHDDLGQHLIGIEVMTKVLKKTLDDKSLEEADYAAEINTLVKEAITKTRRLHLRTWPLRFPPSSGSRAPSSVQRGYPYEIIPGQPIYTTSQRNPSITP